MNAPVEKLTAASGVPGTALVLQDGFSLDHSGLWYRKNESDALVKIAGSFMVHGLARDPNGRGWSVVLTWNDRDGKSHLAFVPLADLIGEGVDVFRPLVSAGLRISPKASHLKLLKECFLGLTCSIRVRLVKQAG